MTSEEIRSKFLTFFEERGHHEVVLSSSLIPDDPSVLLTSAGMQQFKKYYTGEADPMKDFNSLNVCSIQKSFRTSDIDEVGDDSHLTFFEMLGNFSFGGYFKKEAIEYAHEFITKEIGLVISYITIFKGSDTVPKDTESERIWKSLGVADVREEGMEDVFWGPTGASGPCGPTTEIYCKNADGKDVEIWNIVFNEFLCSASREQLLKGNAALTPLEKKGIDTGMGLERLAMISQNKKNIFETDLFTPFHGFMRGNINYKIEMRIIADHMRAITFLLADGVRPLNKERGYILRRLIRRAMVQRQLLGLSRDTLSRLMTGVIEQYGTFYEELKQNQEIIQREFMAEVEKFDRTLKSGAKEFFDKFPDMKVQEIVPGRPSMPHRIKKISGDDAFYFHQSYGLTLDVIKDFAKRGEHIVEVDEREFEKAIERHREISRAGQEKKFGGHGLLLDTGELKAADENELKIVTRLHTATHLLQAALRKILGDEVTQQGSDITAERTRFDFSFPRKLTPEEIKQVEDTVNEAIRRDYAVAYKEMPYDEAVKSGALHFFREKYPGTVKVYSVFNPQTGEVLSRELCGGPHVNHTEEIGHVKIFKEEASSAGIRRIRASVD